LARDSFVFERALTRVWAIRDACGGAYGNLAYTRRVSLVRLLTQLVDAAFQRPRNWCLFSAQQPQHVGELLKATYRLTREAALPALRLVLLLLRTASAPAQAGDAELQAHVRTLVNAMLSRERALLAFVRLILLGGGSADVRGAARNLLHAAWQVSGDAGRAELLRALARVAPAFAQFGRTRTTRSSCSRTRFASAAASAAPPSRRRCAARCSTRCAPSTSASRATRTRRCTARWPTCSSLTATTSSRSRAACAATPRRRSRSCR
jgi:hypothetical protein